MVRRRKREMKASKTLTEFNAIFEPVYLSEERNHERIKRLASQIIDCVEKARRGCKKLRAGASLGDGIFGENYDEIFGLV
jgi:hypothetical protein